MRFGKWLDVMVEEKGYDLEEVFEVDKDGWLNLIPLGAVISAMKKAPAHEKAGMKAMIVKIDFVNADVKGYFRHLARALALNGA